MGKLIKSFLVLLVGLAILGLAAVFVVPKIIDVQKYKTLVMEKVSEATGRKVSLGGDLRLSLFPWVGVSFSDLRLGNPEGYTGKDFIVVKSFEAHVKVMPLLSREVQVDSFILDGPEIFLERTKDGRANWEGLGSSSPKEKKSESATQGDAARVGLKSINVANFTLRDGRLKFVDHQQGITKEVSGLTLQLTDVSLDRPISLAFSAAVEGKTVNVNGVVGPIGPKPGEGTLPLDLKITALDQLNVKMKGQLENPGSNLAYKLTIDIASFSPRKLLSALQMDFPVATADPTAIDTVSLAMKAAGSTKTVTLTDGQLGVDGSKLVFSSNVKNISPLNLKFDGKLDTIDLDRYLPPAAQTAEGQSPGGTGSSSPAQAPKTDYAPLRKLTLDTTLAIGDLKVHGGKLRNVQMHLVGQKGIFQLNPFAMELYGGNVASTATMNVQGKSPATSLDVRTTNVQVGPLLKDFANKDVLEGSLISNVALTLVGDTPQAIKKSLNGKGELLFTDGAIVGIDLAGMVRNVQASFGLAEKPTEKPRTDFAELRAPFTIQNGLVNTPETAMQSPLIRVTVKGDANLVTEALDMKVEPKFVATLKGQGDTAERKGLMVPVLVRGTFSKPEFSPDLTALLQGQLPDAESVKKVLEEGLSPDKVLPKDQGTTIEQGIKSLIPKLQLK